MIIAIDFDGTLEELRKRLVDGGLLQRNAHNVTEAIENLIAARIDEALKQAALRF